MSHDHLPAGRQPYDRMNGARIGAVVGGILTVLIVALTGLTSFWWVVIGALLGGALGYRYQSRVEDRADHHG